MNKYKVVGADEEEEQRYQRAIEQSNDTCPCGSQLAGILFGFLCGMIADLSVDIEVLTCASIGFGSAFATLGSQLENPLNVRRKELLTMAAIVFCIAQFFTIFFPIANGGISSIFMLATLSSSITNYMRPLLLIPMAMGVSFLPWLKPEADALPRTC